MSTICYHCMRETGGGTICPACGHANADIAMRQPTHALPCGAMLQGRYVVGRVLGQGGFGITYIGYDAIMHSRICIKEYYPAGSAMRNNRTTCHVTWSQGVRPEYSQAGKQSFVVEARKAVKLRDLPSVVKVWDVFYENNTAYIVMEFIDGVTLKDHLKAAHAPMTLRDCCKAMEPIMMDLQTIHSMGVIHRDISPDNLMIRSSGEMVLLDLGAARDLSADPAGNGMLVARKGFSPAEQYVRGGPIGPWTDVYAFTATIYYCMTGHPPVSPAERPDAMEINTQGMAPATADFFKQGLALQLRDRFRSMEALRQAMIAAVNASSLLPYRSNLQPHAAPQSQIVTTRVQTQQQSANIYVRTGQQTVDPAGQAQAGNTYTQQQTENTGKSSKKKVVLAVVIPAVAMLVIAAVLTFTVFIPNRRYSEALSLYNAGAYAQALPIFQSLNGYKDSSSKIRSCNLEINYAAALDLYTEGKFEEALETFETIADFRDSEKYIQICKILTSNDVFVEAGSFHVVALKNDGTVYAKGNDEYGQCKVSGWRNVKSVAAGNWHTVALKEDGTVVAVGSSDDGQCRVSAWRDVVAIAAGGWHTVGLKADGTVVATGLNTDGRCNVSGWRDIVSVACGAWHTVGLRSDGTVVATGETSDNRCRVSGWSDIIAVAAGAHHTLGLRADGTVVATGKNDKGQCNVSGWTDIVAIAAGTGHSVGLRADGTVVAVGDNADSQCRVTAWTGVVAIAAGSYNTYGLKSTGTLVAVGYDKYDQIRVSSWTDIRVPD